MYTVADSEDLWLMPLDCLHMTVLEIAYSKTEDEISNLVKAMESRIPRITDYSLDHRSQLVDPMLSYDAAAIALSFLPAGAEGTNLSASAYTYHHLRRDIYTESTKTGVDVASRYIVPSSHLTIARFVSQEDFVKDGRGELDPLKIRKLIDTIEDINADLQAEHWSRPTGQWQVGEEKGLVCRRGRLWYGGGQSQHEGQGF